MFNLFKMKDRVKPRHNPLDDLVVPPMSTVTFNKHVTEKELKEMQGEVEMIQPFVIDDEPRKDGRRVIRIS